jgi:hypothetical protein
MQRKVAAETQVTKRCGTPPETALRFGIGVEKLKRMRLFGVGPEYCKAGHRTVLYDWDKVEHWLASLPKGGGRVQ